MELREALKSIDAGIAPVLQESGFLPSKTKEGKTLTPPIFVEEDKTSLKYDGEQGCLRIIHDDNLIKFQQANVLLEELEASDYQDVATSLFELDNIDDRDIKYIINEFTDTIQEKFTVKKGDQKTARKKTPAPVSKAAARRGDLAFDPNTLAVRLGGMDADLKDCYQEHVDKYGQFLGETFFVEYGNEMIMSIIRENQSQRMKRLFNIINEVYEFGTNEVQNLIVVTIFGELRQEPQLLGRLSEHMEADLFQNVVAVNKYLETGSGKRAEKKLENPPAYKPKKAKKPGLLSRYMNNVNSIEPQQK